MPNPSAPIRASPQPITVKKLNLAHEPVLTYTGHVLEQTPTQVMLEARFGREAIDLGYTIFEKGDRFVEWYFGDRWYNIFEVHARRDDRIKGWYCNVTKPAAIDAERGTVSAVDLAIDVWIGPEGSILVLDEDEFATLDLTEAERRAALDALDELKSMARGRRPPFDGSQRIGVMNG